MGLGKRIRELREARGWSQARLAIEAHVSQGYLCQVEREEVKNPSAAILLRIAYALSIEPKKLLLEEAGYTPWLSEPTVDSGVEPDLAKFIATRMSPEQQINLREILKGPWKGLVEESEVVGPQLPIEIDIGQLAANILVTLRSLQQPFSFVGLVPVLAEDQGVATQRYFVKSALTRLKRTGLLIKVSGAGPKTLWRVAEGF